MRFLFASVLAVAPVLVLAENPEEADFSCFSSSSSEAEVIAGVCDDRRRSGNLWSRRTNGSELAPCDFSSIFSSKCSVCLSDSARPETVLLVLWNLTGSEELKFKGPGFLFNRTDCPGPEPVKRNVGFHISVSCFLLLLLFITMWLICKLHGSQQDSRLAAARCPGVF